MLAAAAVATVVGTERLAAPVAASTGLKLRLVQGNGRKTPNWDASQARAIFARYLALSRGGSDGRSPWRQHLGDLARKRLALSRR